MRLAHHGRTPAAPLSAGPLPAAPPPLRGGAGPAGPCRASGAAPWFHGRGMAKLAPVGRASERRPRSAAAPSVAAAPSATSSAALAAAAALPLPPPPRPRWRPRPWPATPARGLSVHRRRAAAAERGWRCFCRCASRGRGVGRGRGHGHAATRAWRGSERASLRPPSAAPSHGRGRGVWPCGRGAALRCAARQRGHGRGLVAPPLRVAALARVRARFVQVAESRFLPRYRAHLLPPTRVWLGVTAAGAALRGPPRVGAAASGGRASAAARARQAGEISVCEQKRFGARSLGTLQRKTPRYRWRPWIPQARGASYPPSGHAFRKPKTEPAVSLVLRATNSSLLALVVLGVMGGRASGVVGVCAEKKGAGVFRAWLGGTITRGAGVAVAGGPPSFRKKGRKPSAQDAFNGSRGRLRPSCILV